MIACYLALTVDARSGVPCIVDPSVAFFRGGFSPRDRKKRPTIVVLVGEVLDSAFLESAKVTARAARDAGHTVVVVPAVPHDGIAGKECLADAFSEDAMCITIPSHCSLDEDEEDLRRLLLEMDVEPLAIALRIHGAAAVASRLKAAPGLYRIRSADHSWDKTDPGGPDWDYLASTCMGDTQEVLPTPGFLSLTVAPYPTRRLRSRIVRAAHDAFAPSKPLIALADESYGPWGEYRLTIKAMARVA